MSWRREKSLALVGIRTPGRPARSLVTVLTALSWLPDYVRSWPIFRWRSHNCEKWLFASSCLSVCPDGTTRLQLDGFSWNLEQLGSNWTDFYEIWNSSAPTGRIFMKFGATGLQLDGFLWNLEQLGSNWTDFYEILYLSIFSKTCWDNSGFIIIGQEYRILYTKSNAHLW